jgi:hypothetical protein
MNTTTLVVEKVERGRAWCRLQDPLGQVIGRNVQVISAGQVLYREPRFKPAKAMPVKASSVKRRKGRK